jgi:hypothetical protein
MVMRSIVAGGLDAERFPTNDFVRGAQFLDRTYTYANPQASERVPFLQEGTKCPGRRVYPGSEMVFAVWPNGE